MPDELAHVRRFPAEDERVESGPIMFGDDWPGTFIRGDDSFNLAHHLRRLLPTVGDEQLIAREVLWGLVHLLESSNARNNDAFPAWNQPQ